MGNRSRIAYDNRIRDRLADHLWRFDCDGSVSTAFRERELMSEPLPYRMDEFVDEDLRIVRLFRGSLAIENGMPSIPDDLPTVGPGMRMDHVGISISADGKKMTWLCRHKEIS